MSRIILLKWSFLSQGRWGLIRINETPIPTFSADFFLAQTLWSWYAGRGNLKMLWKGGHYGQIFLKFGLGYFQGYFFTLLCGKGEFKNAPKGGSLWEIFLKWYFFPTYYAGKGNSKMLQKGFHYGQIFVKFELSFFQGYFFHPTFLTKFSLFNRFDFGV